MIFRAMKRCLWIDCRASRGEILTGDKNLTTELFPATSVVPQKCQATCVNIVRVSEKNSVSRHTQKIYLAGNVLKSTVFLSLTF